MLAALLSLTALVPFQEPAPAQISRSETRLPYLRRHDRSAEEWLAEFERSEEDDLFAAWCLFHLGERPDALVEGLKERLASEDELVAHSSCVLLDAWGIDHACVTLEPSRAQTPLDIRLSVEFSEYTRDELYFPPLGVFPFPIEPAEGSTEELLQVLQESRHPHDRARAAVTLILRGEHLDEAVKSLVLHFERDFGCWRTSSHWIGRPRDAVQVGGDIRGRLLRYAPEFEAEFHCLGWALHYLDGAAYAGVQRAAEALDLEVVEIARSTNLYFRRSVLSAEGGDHRSLFPDSSPYPPNPGRGRLGGPIRRLVDRASVLRAAGESIVEVERDLAGLLVSSSLRSDYGLLLWKEYFPTLARFDLGGEPLVDLAIEHALGYASEYCWEDGLCNEALHYLASVELSPRQQAALVPFGREPVHLPFFPYAVFQERSDVLLEKVPDLRLLATKRVGPPSCAAIGDFQAFETILEIQGRTSRWDEAYLQATLERGPASYRHRALELLAEREIETPALRAAVFRCADRDPTPSVRRAAELARSAWRASEEPPPEGDGR